MTPSPEPWVEKFRKKYSIKATPNKKEDETKAFLRERYWEYAILDELIEDIHTTVLEAKKEAYEEVVKMAEDTNHTPTDATRYIDAVKAAKHPFDDGFNLGREMAYEHVTQSLRDKITKL